MPGLGGDGADHYRRPGQRPAHVLPISATEEGEEKALRFPGDPGTTLPDTPTIDPREPPADPYADPQGEVVDARLVNWRQLCECIAKEIEQRLVTSRGAAVRAPSTCAQPVRGRDVDDLAIGVEVTATIGARTMVLTRTATKNTVLKGIGWAFAVAAAGSPEDPATQLRTYVLVNGQAVGSSVADDPPASGLVNRGPYEGIPGQLSAGGIVGLTGAQVYLRQGDVVTLEVERIAAVGAPQTDFLVSARWKGWEWDATVEVDGAGGAAGF